MILSLSYWQNDYDFGYFCDLSVNGIMKTCWNTDKFWLQIEDMNEWNCVTDKRVVNIMEWGDQICSKVIHCCGVKV